MRENADIEAHLRDSREQLLIDHFQRRKAELVIDTKFKRTFRGKRIKLGVLLIHFTEELSDLDHRLRDLNGLLRWAEAALRANKQRIVVHFPQGSECTTNRRIADSELSCSLTCIS